MSASAATLEIAMCDVEKLEQLVNNFMKETAAANMFLTDMVQYGTYMRKRPSGNQLLEEVSFDFNDWAAGFFVWPWE